MFVLILGLVTIVTAGKIDQSKIKTKLIPDDDVITISNTSLSVSSPKNVLPSTHKTVQTRNAFTDPDQLWPQGKIPFVFDRNMPAFTTIEILAAMQEIEMSTYSGGKPCILYVPRSTENDYIHISWTSGTHGTTSIGRAGGRQDMTINSAGGRGHDDNLDILMTALGLIPEVMRQDRNSYIDINITNAVSTDPFRILTGHGTSTFGQTFDFDSVVLDSPYVYARDVSWPVTSAKLTGKVMGQSVSLSSGDATLLQHTYHCAVDSSRVIKLLSDLPVLCHFHNDICNFHQDTTDDFDWVVQAGPTTTQGTGPNGDYSSGSGKFALAEARGHHYEVARLITPQIPAGEYCLRFNVNMFGSDAGRLRIFVSYQGGTSDLLTQTGSLPSNTWYHNYPTMTSKVPFTVTIQATIGAGDKGDIAIDDVYIYNGKCIEWN